MRDAESPEEFIRGNQSEKKSRKDQQRDGWTWTMLTKTLVCDQVLENSWKAKNDSVRHCRGQRTVEGVGSDIYGWKQPDDEDLS